MLSFPNYTRVELSWVELSRIGWVNEEETTAESLFLCFVQLAWSFCELCCDVNAFFLKMKLGVVVRSERKWRQLALLHLHLPSFIIIIIITKHSFKKGNKTRPVFLDCKTDKRHVERGVWAEYCMTSPITQLGRVGLVSMTNFRWRDTPWSCPIPMDIVYSKAATIQSSPLQYNGRKWEKGRCWWWSIENNTCVLCSNSNPLHCWPCPFFSFAFCFVLSQMKLSIDQSLNELFKKGCAGHWVSERPFHVADTAPETSQNRQRGQACSLLTRWHHEVNILYSSSGCNSIGECSVGRESERVFVCVLFRHRNRRKTEIWIS